MLGMKLPMLFVAPPPPMPGPSVGGASTAKSVDVSGAGDRLACGSQRNSLCGTNDRAALAVFEACEAATTTGAGAKAGLTMTSFHSKAGKWSR